MGSNLRSMIFESPWWVWGEAVEALILCYRGHREASLRASGIWQPPRLTRPDSRKAGMRRALSQQLTDMPKLEGVTEDSRLNVEAAWDFVQTLHRKKEVKYC